MRLRDLVSLWPLLRLLAPVELRLLLELITRGSYLASQQAAGMADTCRQAAKRGAAAGKAATASSRATEAAQ